MSTVSPAATSSRVPPVPAAIAVAAAGLLVGTLALPWYTARYGLSITGLTADGFGNGSTRQITSNAWGATIASKGAVVFALVGIGAALVALRGAVPARVVQIGAGAAALSALLAAVGLVMMPSFDRRGDTFSGDPNLNAIQFHYHPSASIGVYVTIVSVAVLTGLVYGGAGRTRPSRFRLCRADRRWLVATSAP
jgi:hypothetical protein